MKISRGASSRGLFSTLTHMRLGRGAILPWLWSSRADLLIMVNSLWDRLSTRSAGMSAKYLRSIICSSCPLRSSTWSECRARDIKNEYEVTALGKELAVKVHWYYNIKIVWKPSETSYRSFTTYIPIPKPNMEVIDRDVLKIQLSTKCESYIGQLLKRFLKWGLHLQRTGRVCELL